VDAEVVNGHHHRGTEDEIEAIGGELKNNLHRAGEATCEGYCCMDAKGLMTLEARLLLEGDGWRGVGGSSRDDEAELRLGTIDQIHPKGDPIHSHRHQIDLRAGRSTR
jgi:hypothetical protein